MVTHTTRLALHKSEATDTYQETRTNNSLNFDVLDNVVITNASSGFLCGHGAATVTSNVAIGINALVSNTTGASNVAIGIDCLPVNTTGYQHVAIGYQALLVNTVGYMNVALGYATLKANDTGHRNVAIGATALYTNIGGAFNVAVGYQAMYLNTEGQYNTALGAYSMGACTTGSYNFAVGYQALGGCTTGSDNIGLGYYAGSVITTGSNNVCIGRECQPSAATVSNEITLGNASIAALRCQVTTITALSDRRDKANIQDLPLGLAFLKTVRPVQFKWAIRPEIYGPSDPITGAHGPILDYGIQPEPGRRDIGFISQELDAAETAANANWLGLAYKSNPKRMESNSGKLFPIAVKAIQELSAALDAALLRIAALEAE